MTSAEKNSKLVFIMNLKSVSIVTFLATEAESSHIIFFILLFVDHKIIISLSGLKLDKLMLSQGNKACFAMKTVKNNVLLQENKLCNPLMIH